MVDWRGHREYCEGAHVRLLESESVDASGSVAFVRSWTDSDEGKTHPAHLQIQLPASKREFDFIDFHLKKGDTLCATIELTAPMDVLYSIGPDDCSEPHWILDPAKMPTAELRELFPIAQKDRESRVPPFDQEANAREVTDVDRAALASLEETKSMLQGLASESRRQIRLLQVAVLLLATLAVLLAVSLLLGPFAA